MRLPPSSFGFDRLGMPAALVPAAGGTPAAPADARQAYLWWLHEHTNWRLAGGYPTIPAASVPARLATSMPWTGELLAERRGWSPSLGALADGGWGVVFFALILSRTTLYRTDPVTKRLVRRVFRRLPDPQGRPRPPRPVAVSDYGQQTGRLYDTADLAERVELMDGPTGRTHGRFIKWLLHTRHPEFVLPVVVLDNEDGGGVVFDHDELDYYRQLIAELGTRGPDGPAVRAGFYAHLDIAPQLVADVPDLLVCEVTYGSRVGRVQWPAATAFSGAGATFTPTAESALGSMLVRPVAPRSRPWRAWPVIKQWEGDSAVGLPTAAGETVTFAGRSWKVPEVHGWDFDAAIVPDVTWPAAEPRIALETTGTAATVALGERRQPATDRDPAVGAISSLGALGPPAATTLPPHAGHVTVPGGPLHWVSAGGKRLLVAPVRPAGTHQLRLGMWEPSGMGWVATHLPDAGAIGAGLHAATAVAATRDEVHVFVAGAAGDLQAIRHIPRTGRTEGPRRHGPALTLHPFSQVAATRRGPDAVDVLVVDERGTLTHLPWSTAHAWPGTSTVALGAPGALLASGALAIASPDSGHLIAVGLGADLRLHMASWMLGGGWTGPVPLGGTSELLSPHTRLGIVVDWPRCEVVGISTELEVVIYRLVSTGSGWLAPGPRAVLGRPVLPAAPPGARPPADPVADRFPNQFGDIDYRDVAGTRVLACVWGEVGRSRAWRTTCPPGAAPEDPRAWSAWTPLA